ncbi:MAG: methylmalonyl Co-A mutase-associated GTPase MeaB [Bacteroidales bacterium]
MNKHSEHKNILSVSKGVEYVSSVNPDSRKSFKRRQRNKLRPGKYLEGIIGGNITILSQAITLIESSLQEHQDMAAELVEKCLPYSGNSLRIGITGVPGVGKSSFIESFGKILTGRGAKLAVLAVDPSSGLNRGSILGDKTRMEELSVDPSAFIRPSPSGGSLGGVARKTRESIILCEAAGFDTIIVETVGVGQSETAVKSMVDFFLLLMLAGAGDELQGIKRGIMEMADNIAITKSDGSNIARAGLAKSQIQSALELYPSAPSGWKPRVQTCSSVTKEGLHDIDESIIDYFEFVKNNGFFSRNRKDQSLYWMHESIDHQLNEGFYNDPAIKHELEKIREDVVLGRMSSFTAARKLLEKYFNKER